MGGSSLAYNNTITIYISQLHRSETVDVVCGDRSHHVCLLDFSDKVFLVSEIYSILYECIKHTKNNSTGERKRDQISTAIHLLVDIYWYTVYASILSYLFSFFEYMDYNISRLLFGLYLWAGYRIMEEEILSF